MTVEELSDFFRDRSSMALSAGISALFKLSNAFLEIGSEIVAAEVIERG